MQVIKMDSGIVEEQSAPHPIVMTPANQELNGTRPSELNQSRGDLNNSSHYYRFKRHSLGYQSQGPALKGSPLINLEGMNAVTGAREQS